MIRITYKSYHFEEPDTVTESEYSNLHSISFFELKNQLTNSNNKVYNDWLSDKNEFYLALLKFNKYIIYAIILSIPLYFFDDTIKYFFSFSKLSNKIVDGLLGTLLFITYVYWSIFILGNLFSSRLHLEKDSLKNNYLRWRKVFYLRLKQEIDKSSDYDTFIDDFVSEKFLNRLTFIDYFKVLFHK